MNNPRLEPGNFSLWQRALAIGVAILSIVGAAIAGFFLLYILLTLIAFGIIAAVVFTLWRRFFAPQPSTPPGHDNMNIREDAEGIIIDVAPAGDEEGPHR